MCCIKILPIFRNQVTGLDRPTPTSHPHEETQYCPETNPRRPRHSRRRHLHHLQPQPERKDFRANCLTYGQRACQPQGLTRGDAENGQRNHRRSQSEERQSGL